MRYRSGLNPSGSLYVDMTLFVAGSALSLRTPGNGTRSLEVSDVYHFSSELIFNGGESHMNTVLRRQGTR